MGSWHWQTECKSIKERNQYMYDNKVFSDVEFSVVDSKGDTVTVPGNRYILAVSSPVFEAMFYGEMAETRRICTIALPNNTDVGLLELFRYMYYEEVNLTGSHVIEVLYLAKEYMVPSLVNKCTRYLQENLQPNDVLSILQQAIKLEDKNLEQICWNIVDSDTQRAVTSDYFLDVTQETLCEILERDTLKIKEVELFKAVDRWAAKKTKEQGLAEEGKSKRSVLGEKAIKLIRFPLMSLREFAEFVIVTGILSYEEVTELIQYYSSVQLISYFSSEKRSATKFKGKQLELKRCIFGESIQHPPTWRYSRGTVDSITFTVNKPIHLTGVRLFGRKDSRYNVQLMVNIEGKDQSLYQTHATYNSEITKGCYGFIIVISTPVSINPGVKYTIKALIKGPASFYLRGGCNVIKYANVTFTFEGSTSPNGTSDSTGQFPELLFTIK